MTAERQQIPNRPQSSLLHRLEYAAFCSIKWGLGCLTVQHAASISAFFWRLIAPRLSRHKRANTNLILALSNLSVQDRQQLLTRMWDNLGRTSAETLRLN
jgi:Kdo2-lipid IVA lauroyltransferase/acyltransferase